MSFQLFGVNVEIQMFFWFTAGVLGYFSGVAGVPEMVVFILVVLISILVHEFGHAFAFMRHGIRPEITLHGMGGVTRPHAILPLGRLDQVVIAAAGPVSGFMLAGVLYAIMHLAPSLMHSLPQLGWFAVTRALYVNIYWGIFNLIPVLPFDGGHILEHALGPKRSRISAGISFVVGAGAAIYFAVQGMIWAAMLVGMGALRSFQRLQAAAPAVPVATTERRWPPPAKDPLPPEIEALLRSARHALAEEDVSRAMDLAQQVLEGETTLGQPDAEREAFEIITWAHLLAGHLEIASESLACAKKRGEPDAALVGAVLFARRDLGAARKVLEEARARGDDRKEVVGPLIQILIEQGEITRAAAVALDIVDALSTEDARKMAQIALDHRAYSWSARLSAALFDRQKDADDAYDAARALALDGNQERALEWLKKAVDAGFSDRARAWSDAALTALQTGAGLESVLPRP